MKCHVLDVPVLIPEKPNGVAMHTRVRDHGADLKNHRSSSAFVAYAEEEGHLTDWSGVAVIGQNFTQKKNTKNS